MKTTLTLLVIKIRLSPGTVHELNIKLKDSCENKLK